MKLRNFLLLVVLVGGGAITASYMACSKSSEPAKTKDEHIAMPPPADAAVAAAPVAIPAPPPTPHADLLPRPYDAEVLAWRGKPLAAGKGKDVSKGHPFKINVYQDAGSKTVDRVKVDANRNNKFDDKITFKSNEVTLEHAPADDEKYTEKYVWNGAGWTKQ
jgi:hypothetical protein